MSFETWVYVIAFILSLIGSVVIVVSALKFGVPRKQKGTSPGQGGSLIAGGARGSNGMSSGTIKAYTVTKDPKEYAKAFVPSSAKEQKK